MQTKALFSTRPSGGGQNSCWYISAAMETLRGGIYSQLVVSGHVSGAVNKCITAYILWKKQFPKTLRKIYSCVTCLALLQIVKRDGDIYYIYVIFHYNLTSIVCNWSYKATEQIKTTSQAFLTELKAIIPKALSLDRMVIVALFGFPKVTPLEELWKAGRIHVVNIQTKTFTVFTSLFWPQTFKWKSTTPYPLPSLHSCVPTEKPQWEGTKAGSTGLSPVDSSG